MTAPDAQNTLRKRESPWRKPYVWIAAAGCLIWGIGAAAADLVRRWPAVAAVLHHRLDAAANAAGAAAVVRHRRRLRPSADDRRGDPRRSGEFRPLPCQLLADAARRGISAANYQRLTQGLTPDLRIMDLLDAQPEFTKSVWDYLDMLVTDARMQRGREILTQYKPIFDAVEKTTGVDRYIIASIWGVESNYSTMGGDRSVVRSTATLACIGRRQAYFKDEFLSALEILNHGDLKPEQLVGSWAGAFGPTQFMPTAFKRYAVDFDGDGKRDVVNDVGDLIASTANNLKKDGWVAGSTWGYEVEVPQNFNYMYADRGKILTVAQWQQLGIRRPGGAAFPR